MDERRKKEELDRLAGLARAGAVRAAAAFAQLVNSPIVAGEPIVLDPGAGAPGGARQGPSEDAGATGVFFAFEGCLEAQVGILFPAEGSDRLVRSVVGIESGPLDPTIVESALMEVGNILASHVASGIADALRSRLLPSIPALAAEHAEREFEAFLERGAGCDRPRIEVGLGDARGRAAGRLVIVPVEAAADAATDARR